jgi:DNA-binding MarR family transcriptional regulator
MELDLDLGRDPDVVEVADALRVSVGLLRRRIRQLKAAEGEVTLPESAALARLDRGGPATSSELARLEQISPQSMGATLAGLEARGLVARRPDPNDGRRAVLYLTPAGQAVLRDRRNESTQRIAQALAAGFTAAEQRQLLAAARLLERLAQDI